MKVYRPLSVTQNKLQQIAICSVSDALRHKDGQIKVTGIIISKSQTYKTWNKLGKGHPDLRPTVDIEINQIPYNQSRDSLKGNPT